MIDYKTFKKGYLNEWVDQSQAARKAAEELANKDTTSLRDKYKDELPVFSDGGYTIEFKKRNEVRSNGSWYFTWEEAMMLFGKPDKDGWRLPGLKDFKFLVEPEGDFSFSNGTGFFKNGLTLPADGTMSTPGVAKAVGIVGSYWTNYDPPKMSQQTHLSWMLSFTDATCYLGMTSKTNYLSVRLVREVK